ncbi:MAG: hypothetical protein LUD29_04835 [Clostridia bacterium]|nr:hypothetical protein [Clostridia bacterium]
MKKDIYRARPYEYRFCVSEEEKKVIDKNIELSGLTKREYLCVKAMDKSAHSGNTKVIVVEQAPQIRRDLIKIGTNMNQGAKALNEIKLIYRNAFANNENMWEVVLFQMEHIDDAIELLLDSREKCCAAVKVITDLGGKR